MLNLFLGLRIWNYNKQPQDAYRGAKILIVEADKHLISPVGGLLLKKAPGDLSYDFA